MAPNKDTSVSSPPTALEALSASAQALNSATQRLAKTIENLDAALKKLNLGISSWVRVSYGSSEDGRFWSKEELGYDKVNGRWGLALRVLSGHEALPDDDKCTAWLYCDAARELRIRALRYLPTLMAQLNKDAESVTARIADEIQEAEVLTEAINAIVAGNPGAAETKGESK
jgi:hypothetical protein